MRSRMRPVVDDRISEGFWEGARHGVLMVQVCAPEGHVLHLPKGYCCRCDTTDVEWRPVEGAASVHTWTIVEHSVDPAYTIALVELEHERGVRFVTDLPGRQELHVGQRMELRFEDLGDDVVIPRWIPA